jgi:hypothetical protein
MTVVQNKTLDQDEIENGISVDGGPRRARCLEHDQAQPGSDRFPPTRRGWSSAPSPLKTYASRDREKKGRGWSGAARQRDCQSQQTARAGKKFSRRYQ